MDLTKKKSTLILSNREKLSQFSQNLDNDVSMGLSNVTLDKNKSNWKHELLCCGSNSFNQLNANLQDLMIPIFKHIVPISGNEGKEILQISCNGNQTAVLYGEEKESNDDINNENDDHNNKDLNPLNKKFDYQLYLWGSGKSSSQMSLPVTIPLKCTIKKLACGQSHAGFITESGAVFTWGSGDYGMLGHGTKNSVASPKRIESMKSLVCSAISCGAFHTAFIACPKDKTLYIRLPQRPTSNLFSGIGYAGASIALEEEYATAGDLYSCGLGKGGQLGLNIQLGQLPHSGANAGISLRPALVPYFEEISHRIIKVSCGFHHTLVITVPAQSTRIFIPTIYAFGYGEHGRLGVGSEEQIATPIQVLFNTPFHPTSISAGEQHSVAIGREGCYSWGSNDHGQLGIGSPKEFPFTVLPQKIQIPEGMLLKKIIAGGRHTAGITFCGNILCWGWGEEGQLGHNTEKSSFLPKPCKLPFIYNKPGIPIDITLGGTHTYIVMHNQDYVVPSEPKIVSKEKEIEPIENNIMIEENIEELIINNEEVVIPNEEPVEEEELVLEEVPNISAIHKPPALAEEENYDSPKHLPVTPPTPAPVRSIKDILNQREERKANLIQTQVPVVIEPSIIIIEKEEEQPNDENIIPEIEMKTYPIKQESEPMIVIPPVPEEYNFDAIPFQHSRKRSEISKLRKSNSMTK